MDVLTQLRSPFLTIDQHWHLHELAAAEIERLRELVAPNAGLSWDDYFMRLAQVTSAKSKDPSTRVGAVIVDNAQRIVSTGYNGFPRKVADTPERLQHRQTKLSLTIHAEENAMLFARRDLSGCTCYTYPLPPCSTCAAKLAQVGITRIVSPAPHADALSRWGESFNLAQEVYNEAGIDFVTAPIGTP